MSAAVENAVVVESKFGYGGNFTTEEANGIGVWPSLGYD